MFLAVIFYPYDFTCGLEASLVGQLFIFRTISQSWTLLADILANQEALFTKHMYLIFEVGITLLWKPLSGQHLRAGVMNTL